MKRTRRMGRLGLSDHESYPTGEVLEEAYVRQMQRLKSSEFRTDKKKQRAKKRASRAFTYLMKLGVEDKTSCD